MGPGVQRRERWCRRIRGLYVLFVGSCWYRCMNFKGRAGGHGQSQDGAALLPLAPRHCRPVQPRLHLLHWCMILDRLAQPYAYWSMPESSASSSAPDPSETSAWDLKPPHWRHHQELRFWSAWSFVAPASCRHLWNHWCMISGQLVDAVMNFGPMSSSMIFNLNSNF